MKAKERLQIRIYQSYRPKFLFPVCLTWFLFRKVQARKMVEVETNGIHRPDKTELPETGIHCLFAFPYVAWLAVVLICFFFCRRDKWFTNWASQAYSSNHRWSNIAMLDISYMGFGGDLLCSPVIPESILRLPTESSIHIIGCSSDCSPPNRKVYGCIFTKQNNLHSRNKMVIFIESRALQHERACPHHHICQFRIKSCLCSEYYYHC